MAAWFYRQTFWSGYRWNLEHLLLGVGNLMKSNQVDAIVVDDYDVTTYLRKSALMVWDKLRDVTWDKLAMHCMSEDLWYFIPAFCSLFKSWHQYFCWYCFSSMGFKPRSEASAIRYYKVHDKRSMVITKWETTVSNTY
jgi:hypothetical protein